MTLLRDLVMSNAQLRRLHYRVMRARRGTRGEADEAVILSNLATQEAAPKTFIEFGFHPVKFNCATFARAPDWQGLLIDGNADQVKDARTLLPHWLDIQHRFLSLDNLDFIIAKFPKLGILSIDVDGNDYWFLERLIGIEPAIISIEYNASFGLAPITVPYDPAFDRHEKHASGWYHGASLTAISQLCRKNGFGLAAVSQAGANAFFTKTGCLDPSEAWQPNQDRNAWSKTSQYDQWEAIKGMPYVDVSFLK
jgi:hypothetical protein